MGVIFDNVRQGFNLLFTPVIYYGVVASIALQLGTWERGDRTQDKIQDQYANKADTFDFIIVGGGTAGSVLVNRLSQYYSVLLLESGGEPHPLQFVPGLTRQLVNHPQVDWMHKTVAQKKSSAFSQYKRATWVSGKTLGGSGMLDFLMYLRGNPEDFDNWARITKDVSWKYDNLLPHFQRAEDIVANSTDPSAHRHGGELRIQQSNYLPLAKEFVAAAKELGYPQADLNGHFTEGFDSVFSTIKKGERQSPVRAFLDPVRKRKTVTIRKFAQVTKLRFRSDNTAYGLEYERHGEKITVYAKREIILSAGAVGSPKILMLSGIGPKKHLEEFGIKSLVNLPVGQNLQDHVGTYLGPFFINEPLSFLKDRDITANSYLEYGTSGSGPLTSAGFQATGLISSAFAKGRGEEKWPDLQLTLYASSVDPAFGTDIAHTHGLQGDILKKYYNHAIGKHSFHIVTSLSRPAGRGEIKLASRNFVDPLVINPKYLEDPWNLDIKAMVDGVKKALRLVEGSTTFQNIGGHFTSEILPGCDGTKFRSDEYFECYIRHYTVSMYNPVGSCAMGPKDSLFAVVDPKLRVIGTKNLRVVDASIMPSIVVGGTQAATIMIAEKGAQMILNYWSHHNPDDNFKHFTEVSNTNSIETVSSESNIKVKTATASTTTTTTTTAKPTTSFKTVRPFSVTIKTSNPSPTPFIVQNDITSKPTVSYNPQELESPKSSNRPLAHVTDFVTTPQSAHVTLPIISSSFKKTKTSEKPLPIHMYRPLPKLHYYPTLKDSKPTLKPTRRYRTTTPKPTEEVTTTRVDESTTSSYPIYEYSSTVATIQPADEISYNKYNNNDSLIATTYRPEIYEQQSDFYMTEEPTKALSFGKSILYLVEKETKENQEAQEIKPQLNDFTYQNQKNQEFNDFSSHYNKNQDQEYTENTEVGQEVKPQNDFSYEEYPQKSQEIKQVNDFSYFDNPVSQIIPPQNTVTYQQQNYYKQPTKQPVKMTNYYRTIPQFDFQEVDQGYPNDRYARHQNNLKNNNNNNNEQSRSPTLDDVRAFLRSVPSGPVQQQQSRRTHYNRQQQQPQEEYVSQESRKVSSVIQPASILYHGSADSLKSSGFNYNPKNNNNYQRSPLYSQTYPVRYTYYK